MFKTIAKLVSILSAFLTIRKLHNSALEVIDAQAKEIIILKRMYERTDNEFQMYRNASINRAVSEYWQGVDDAVNRGRKPSDRPIKD